MSDPNPVPARLGPNFTALREHISGWVNVRSFKAKGDGVTDDTGALSDAQTYASGAGKDLYFPAGNYAHSGLTYANNVRWYGAGMGITTLSYAGSSVGVDCVGTTGSRKTVMIQDMTLDGTSSTGTGIGIQFGWNQRSLGALTRVMVRDHAGWGIYFSDDTWQMSFSDVFVYANGRLANGGIGTAAAKQHNAITWHHLEVESNGANPLTIAGGIDMPGNVDSINQVAYYGLLLQGNAGLAEARWLNVGALRVSGLYLESDLPGGTGCTDGVIVGGNSDATFSSIRLAAVATHVGKAFRAIGTSKVQLEAPWIHPSNWATAIAAEDTANVSLISEGRYDYPLTVAPNSVAAGAAIVRHQPRIVALTDAATVSVDASLGTVYDLTLGGNRTMGAPTNSSVGQRITFIVRQDGTGARTLAWTAPDYKHGWSDTGNVASAASTISFVYDGSRWRQDGAQSPYAG